MLSCGRCVLCYPLVTLCQHKGGGQSLYASDGLALYGEGLDDDFGEGRRDIPVTLIDFSFAIGGEHVDGLPYIVTLVEKCEMGVFAHRDTGFDSKEGLSVGCDDDGVDIVGGYFRTADLVELESGIIRVSYKELRFHHAIGVLFDEFHFHLAHVFFGFRHP